MIGGPIIETLLLIGQRVPGRRNAPSGAPPPNAPPPSSAPSTSPDVPSGGSSADNLPSSVTLQPEALDSNAGLDPLALFDDPIFLGLISVAVIFGILILIHKIAKAQSANSENSKPLDRPSSSPRKRRRLLQSESQFEGESKASGNEFRPVSEVHVTEKTRQEITGIIAGVKSVTGAQTVTKEQLEAIREGQKEMLESSGVMDAFVEDFVSKVESEETKSGRFSKMTLEAGLIFDSEELQAPKQDQPPAAPSRAQTSYKGSKPPGDKV